MRGIRRKEKTIADRAEIVRILEETKYVTVAMTDNDGPYLVTLTHAYDEEKNAIYFHCAHEGRKVDILSRDSRVWGQALIDKGYVEGSCDHLYETAQFKGRVVFLDDPAEKRHALQMMIQKNEGKPEAVIKDQVTDESVSHVSIGRIDIELLSGKRSDKVTVSL